MLLQMAHRECTSGMLIRMAAVVAAVMLAIGIPSAAGGTGGGGFSNSPPVAEYKEIGTTKVSPVQFLLIATHPDLDVADPDAYPLEFTILDPPQYGTLEGDVENVQYAGPNKAYVELAYVPQSGFKGTDSVHYKVTDKFGNAGIATVNVEVYGSVGGGANAMGAFSGTWNAELTFRQDSSGVDAFNAFAFVDYRLGDHSFRMRGNISGFDFDRLTLEARMPLGELLLRSTLLFDPQVPEFEYLRAIAQFTAFETDFTHTMFITGEEGTSYNQMVARGSLNGVTFTSTTRFTGIGLAFDHQIVRARWYCDLCQFPVDTQLRLNKEGFEHFRVVARDVRLPFWDTDWLQLYADVETTFSVDAKTVIPSLKLRSTWVYCVRGLFEIGAEETEDGGWRVGDVWLYGYDIRVTLEGGIQFRTATSLVPGKNAAVTGFGQYFEYWMLSGPIAPCCGAPGLWQIATYFSENGEELFGWGRTRMVLEFPIAPRIRIRNTLTVRSEVEDEWAWELKTAWTVRF